MPAAARAVNVPASGTQQLVTGPGVYQGASIRETAGAAAVVRIWDNTSAAGTLIAAASFPANGNFVDNPGNGVFFAIGVFVEVVSGAVQGCVRI